MNWIMVLDYWSLIRAEHNQTHAAAQLRVADDVECCFRYVYLVVCAILGDQAAVSRGEQNRYGWRRRTLLTARLIKFYGGLRRRLGALV